jgi:hypothetical protein
MTTTTRSPPGIGLAPDIEAEVDRAHDAIAELLVDELLDRRAVDLEHLIEPKAVIIDLELCAEEYCLAVKTTRWAYKKMPAAHIREWPSCCTMAQAGPLLGAGNCSQRRSQGYEGEDSTVKPGNAGATAGKAAAVGNANITISDNQTLALCCSGGGIRSATFNLGVIQALQAARIFTAVKTVTAVSGGSYLAAAHALVTANPARLASGSASAPAAGGQENQAHPLSPPPAYALRSPEERHLRDHTRYLLETWQIAVRAIATLIRGVLVNAILVGSLIFISAHLAGWLVSAQWIGILTGLHTGSPKVELKWYWLIPAVLAVATLSLAWLQALPTDRGPRRSARGQGGKGAALHSQGGWRPRLMRLIFRNHPARWSNRALVCLLATAFVLVAAPLAVKGLYTVSLRNGGWSTITRFLGFSSSEGCKAAATAAATAAHANHQVCGTIARFPAAANSNGGSANDLTVRLTTFGSAAAAIVALARTTIGRLRTYQANLKSGPFAGVAAKVGGFLQRRLVPWIGSGLIVAGILTLTLRWIGNGASAPPTEGGWNSQLMQCLYALAAFLLVKMLVDINSTSMHGFYRDRLAAAYGVVRQPTEDGAEVSDAPWSMLSTLVGRDGPTLVICAAANCTKSGDLPPGRGCVSFTFTPDDIGLSREPKATCPSPGSRAETKAYEDKAGLTLFDAVAVSGAAVSPVMGKMTRPSMRILLAAAGVRLGVWLDSPEAVNDYRARVCTKDEARTRAAKRRPRLSRLRQGIAGAFPGWLRRGASAVRRHWLQPDLQHLWAEAAGSLHLDGRWIYVTDGGHYENLGMVEALRRVPDHLIVVDASADAPGGFTTLGQAIALARSELGVQVEINSVDDLKPNDKGLCAKPYATGRFSYPGEEEGAAPHHLIYIKLAVPDSAPLDVIAYQQQHPTFPTDSTLQQLYDDQEFEAYRELGHFCAHAAVHDIEYGHQIAPDTIASRLHETTTVLANVTPGTGGLGSRS